MGVEERSVDEEVGVGIALQFEEATEHLPKLNQRFAVVLSFEVKLAVEQFMLGLENGDGSKHLGKERQSFLDGGGPVLCKLGLTV